MAAGTRVCLVKMRPTSPGARRGQGHANRGRQFAGLREPDPLYQGLAVTILQSNLISCACVRAHVRVVQMEAAHISRGGELQDIGWLSFNRFLMCQLLCCLIRAPRACLS